MIYYRKDHIMIRNKSSPEEIALGLEQFLEKNRESLTVTEVKLLEETIELLEKLNNPEVMNGKNITQTVVQITTNLLKFLTCEDFREFVKELW